MRFKGTVRMDLIVYSIIMFLKNKYYIYISNKNLKYKTFLWFYICIILLKLPLYLSNKQYAMRLKCVFFFFLLLCGYPGTFFMSFIFLVELSNATSSMVGE